MEALENISLLHPFCQFSQIWDSYVSHNATHLGEMGEWRRRQTACVRQHSRQPSPPATTVKVSPQPMWPDTGLPAPHGRVLVPLVKASSPLLPPLPQPHLLLPLPSGKSCFCQNRAALSTRLSVCLCPHLLTLACLTRTLPPPSFSKLILPSSIPPPLFLPFTRPVLSMS